MTNGRSFEFYKILFEQPISARLIFSIDLSDASVLKNAANHLQHLHKDSVVKKGFKPLWNKCEATDPYNIAGILCSHSILKNIKKLIKSRYNEKCDDEIVLNAVHKIIAEKMDPALVKPLKVAKSKARKDRNTELAIPATDTPVVGSEVNN